MLCAAFPLACLAGTASAQSDAPAPFTLAAAPAEQALVVGGGSAIFHLTVTNGDESVLPRDLVLSAERLPADWLYSVEPRTLRLEPGAVGNATLTITPDANATAGGPHEILVRATQAATAVSPGHNATATVRVVLEEPASPPPPDAPDPVRLSISARDATGRPGTSVAGALALVSDDDRRLEIELDIIGPASWSPDLSLTTRVLYPGQGVQYVSLYATIPASVANGTEQTFTVTARTLGETFSTIWTVTAEGEPVTSTTGGTTTQPAGGTDATGTGEGGTTTAPTPSVAPPAQPGLRIDIAESLVRVRAGEGGENVAIVDNTGGTPLTVRLEGSAHGTWGAFRFEQDVLELPAGARREVPFSWDVPEDIVPVLLPGVAVTARSVDDGSFVQTTRFDLDVVDALPAAPTPDDDTTPAATLGVDSPTVALPATWGLAAGVGAVGVGALALARRPWREKLLWGAAGLYTRLARPDVLGHDEREKLYHIIETTPGIHFHALQRQLGWNTGTLTYHLRVLERHGFVVSRRDGLYRRFYLQGAAPRKETFNDGPTGLRADVLEAIRNQHGMSQTDLALALGANKQTVNYHVKALERGGMIRVVKQGRETFLYPADAALPGGAEPAQA